MAAIIRSVVHKHAELLRKQLKYAKQSKELVYSIADQNGELQLVGELDFRKL